MLKEREKMRTTLFQIGFFLGGVLSEVGRNKCKQIDSFKRSQGVKDVVKPVFTLLDCFALERFFMPTF